MQYAEEISEFDKVDKVGNDYWFKTTGKLHVSRRNRIFSRNAEATYSPEGAERVDHRRILYDKLKPGKEKDFWRYRTRLVKALEAANWPNRVSTLNCNSGCDGNWVMVRYHHKDFLKTKMKLILKYSQLWLKNTMNYLVKIPMKMTLKGFRCQLKKTEQDTSSKNANIEFLLELRYV